MFEQREQENQTETKRAGTLIKTLNVSDFNSLYAECRFVKAGWLHSPFNFSFSSSFKKKGEPKRAIEPFRPLTA